MKSSTPERLDLSILGEPLGALPEESHALSAYPQLADFRSRLGNTPLMDVPAPEGGARIMAKCEFANPFGSVKDRPAYGLLCSAVTGHLGQQRPLKLLDISGGNFGLALGGLGALTGIPIKLVLPDSCPPSLLKRFDEDGVEVDLTPASEFLYGLITRAETLAEADPSWTHLRQMRNPVNLAVHEFMTGAEVVRQLGETRPSCLVGSIGTGGTLAGVGRALRRAFGDVALVSVTPREMPYGTTAPPNGERKAAGGGGLGYGMRQPFADRMAPGLDCQTVPYPRALDAMAEFRRLTGMKIGASAAANWTVARDVAAQLGAGHTVVVIFPDSGLAEEWENIGAR
jgi:cysteine synthase